MVLRVTRQDIEVASTGDGELRATRQFVEVLTQSGAPQVFNRTVDHSLIFSQGSSVSINIQTAQSLDFAQETTVIIGLQTAQNFEFSQTLAYTGSISYTVAQGLEFSQTADSSITDHTIAQGLEFSQALTFNQGFAVSATSAFSFSHSLVVMPYCAELIQGFIFTDNCSNPSSIDVGVTQAFSFTQQADCNFVTFVQELMFTHIAGGGLIIPGGIEVDAIPSNLVFTDNVARTWIKATATSHSTSNSLVFTHWAGFPKEQILQQTFVFTDVMDDDFIRLVKHWIVWSQSYAEYNSIRFPIASDNLVFQHAFITDGVGSLCIYDPVLGYSSDPNAPTPPSSTAPTLVRQNHVRLYWPTVIPTKAVQIRAPMLGDRDRLQNMRIQRESRGGTLQVFADPTWPKLQILALTFTGLTETEAAAVQQFFLDSLGLEVGFEDWDGRIWHGVIITPDEPFVRSRRDIVDISFEFEGELQ